MSCISLLRLCVRACSRSGNGLQQFIVCARVQPHLQSSDRARASARAARAAWEARICVSARVPSRESNACNERVERREVEYERRGERG